MFEYKGYTGIFEYDPEARIFHGEVVDLRDVITFQGTAVDELEQAFQDSVDDYLEFCKELKREPQKPFSGKFVVRIDPELHKRITIKAKAQRVSINKLVEGLIRDAVCA
ncbi:MAG: type II toxin-antitoxin system HicB family antitoxin [Chloroflexi bacterium]|nr:type II toxin-antitoxin system HicB family antitoxin [Chloroflexota bacterium]